MRTISRKGGRRVWLMLIQRCEVATTVPVTQAVECALREAGEIVSGRYH